jgi:hypothetical protein
MFTGLFSSCAEQHNAEESVFIESPLTFYQHIQPIIFSHCTPCHYESGVAPFPLLEYAHVMKHSEMIKVVVANKYMPPWPADRHFSSFRNERGLSQAQIDTLLSWLSQGAEIGESALSRDFVPPFVEIKSDTIIRVSINQPFYHPGDGKDRYMNFHLPANIEQDYWIRAVDIIPGDRKVVHHAWIFANNSQLSSTLSAQQIAFGFEGGFGELPMSRPIVGYLPGMSANVFGEDLGKKVSAGTELFLQIHYFGSSIATQDQTEVLLYLDKSPVKNELHFSIISEENILNGPLEIPANKVKTFKGEFLIDQDMFLFSITPHMHYRGKSFKVYASRPGSKEKIPLIHIPDWNFDWQTMYYFKEHLFLPKDSKVFFTVVYDNTARNMNNPVIPPVHVYNAESSLDEVMQIVLEYYTP